MKAVPNMISICRIILSLTLFCVTPLSAAFYAVYIVCGLSDMLDGFIARKTGTASKLGAKLDSMGDLVMAGVLLFILYPTLHLTTTIFIWLIFIGVIRFAAMAVALKKYKTFASIHTYGNKITGIVLFIFPIFLPYIHSTVLMYTICVMASISAIEELMIQLTSGQLQLDRKSIFIK